ncbi:MAG: hypothetical protein HQK83_01930 [Fibrobacteria bacterium]|nr:hypothetical protein [Fibrobacteria bacterium]
MAKRSNQNTAAAILYQALIIYVCLFISKVAFGAIYNAKSLLVAGLPSLFGAFTALLCIIEFQAKHKKKSHKKAIFSYDKLSFFLLAGLSLIIVLATCALLYAFAHVMFFHMIYPPAMASAWIAVIFMAINFILLNYLQSHTSLHTSKHYKKLIFITGFDFLCTAASIFIIIISRSGPFITDYLAAAAMALGVLIYSIYSLSKAYQSLMDTSLPTVSRSLLKPHILRAHKDIRLIALKIVKQKNSMEIYSSISLSETTSVKQSKTIIRSIIANIQGAIAGQSNCYVNVKGRHV